MSVHNLQVIIGAGPTRISAVSVPVRQINIQNNAAHAIRCGDSTTTAASGIALASGSPGGALTLGTMTAYNTDLSDWFIAGTNGDVIDVVYIN